MNLIFKILTDIAYWVIKTWKKYWQVLKCLSCSYLLYEMDKFSMILLSAFAKIELTEIIKNNLNEI